MTPKHPVVIGIGIFFVCVVSVLAITVSAQQTLVKTANRLKVLELVKIESSAVGGVRIRLLLNTSPSLAEEVVLESTGFNIRDVSSGLVIESSDPVNVRGRSTTTLTWDRDFKLRIQSDGSLDWFCCPRKN